MNIDYTKLPAKGEIEASRQRFKFCAGQHLLKHAVPNELGGLGDRFQDLVATHFQLGQACQDPGLLLSINAHLWGAVFPLVIFGNPAQQQTWLPGLLSGRLIAGHAITEPEAGSDIAALSATATATEYGFSLTGTKRYITNSPIADALIVYAKLDNRLSAFIVNKHDNGAEFTANAPVTGCLSATMGELILNNCCIPHDRQLGKTGAGSLMLQTALELERAFIFAGIAGVMDWQLATVVRYSRSRISNGKHLGHHQAISHKIAGMKLRLDSIQLWVNECARLKDQNQRLTLASAQTKLFASEAFLQSSLDAVQILGAGGMQVDQPMAALVQDAMASRLFSGTSEIQKNIIAGLLGVGAGYKD